MTRACLVCNTSFAANPYRIAQGTAKYCSNTCRCLGSRKHSAGVRECSDCHVFLQETLENFNKNQKTGSFQSVCKRCKTVRAAAYRKKQRAAFIARQGNKCSVCGVYNSEYGFFDIDHIVPIFISRKKRSGTSALRPEEHQVLCPNCHRLKTMAEGSMRQNSGREPWNKYATHTAD